MKRKVTVEWFEDDVNLNAMLIAVAGWIKTIADRELLPEQNVEFDDEEQDFWIISTEIRRDNAPPKIDGAQLITVERNEQIKKHGRSVEQDVIENDKKQLSIAAGWPLKYQPLFDFCSYCLF